MKYSNTVKAFRDAYGIVSGVIPTKSPKPILQNAKLRVTDAGADLSATDLERGIRHPILGGQAIEAGQCLLPGDVTSKILSSADDATLTIETSGDKIKVSCGKAKWGVNNEDADLFPEVPGLTGDIQVTVAPADLVSLVARTKHAVDVKTTKYALGGMMVSTGPDLIRFVATDGRRLAIQEFPAEVSGEVPKNSVIPVAFANLVAAVAKGSDDPAEFRIDAYSVIVRMGGSTIYGRLAEGRFPDYRGVFPEGTARTVAGIDPGSLAEALDQASAPANETSRGIDFTFGPGLLTLSFAGELGSSEVEFPVEYDGPELPVTFDPRYLTDAVKGLAGHPISIDVIDHKNAVVVRTECGFTSVIMPLTRDR